MKQAKAVAEVCVEWAVRSPYFAGETRESDNIGRPLTEQSATRLAEAINAVWGSDAAEIVHRTILTEGWSAIGGEPTTQWAIQTRDTPASPWERLDDGAGGTPYSETDARQRARGYRGGARVVHRQALFTDWEPDAAPTQPHEEMS